MKPIKNYLEMDTVEAIFDRSINLVVNGEEIHPVVRNKLRLTDNTKKEALELCSKVAPKYVEKDSFLLEDKEEEDTTSVVDEEAVRIFVEKIIDNAMSVVSAKSVIQSEVDEDDSTVVDVEPKDVSNLEEVEIFVNDVLSRALNVVTHEDNVSAIPENSFLFVTEEEEAVNMVDVDAVEIFGDGVIDKTLEILKNAVTLEDDVSTEDAFPFVTEEEETLEIGDDEAAMGNEEPVSNLAIFKWNEVKVGVDGVISRGPEVKSIREEESQALEIVEDEATMESEEPVPHFAIVNSNEVKVGVDGVITKGPEVMNIREKESQVPGVQEDHAAITNQNLFGDGRTEKAISVNRKKEAVAMEQSYTVAVFGKAVSMAVAVAMKDVTKGIDDMTTDGQEIVRSNEKIPTTTIDIADAKRPVLSSDARIIVPSLVADKADFEEVAKADANDKEHKDFATEPVCIDPAAAESESHLTVYDGDMVPVFFNKQSGEYIDFSKRDHSIPMSPKDMLSLLSTVKLPEAIIDTAAGVGYYSSDFEDEQPSVIDTIADVSGFTAADDVVINEAVYDKEKKKMIIGTDEERQSAVAEKRADYINSDLESKLRELNAFDIRDVNSPSFHKNELPLLDTAKTSDELVVNAPDIGLGLSPTGIKATSSTDVATNGVKRETITGEYSSSNDDDDAIPRSHSNIQQACHLMKYASVARDNYLCDYNLDKADTIQGNSIKREMFKAEYSSSKDDNDAAPRSHSNFQQACHLMEGSLVGRESYLNDNNTGEKTSLANGMTREVITAEYITPIDDDDAVPRSNSYTQQACHLMEDCSVAHENYLYDNQEKVNTRLKIQKDGTPVIEVLSQSGSKGMVSMGRMIPSRPKNHESGGNISKEKLSLKGQDSVAVGDKQDTSKKVKEHEASSTSPFLTTPPSQVSWVGKMASRLSISLSKQNQVNVTERPPSISVRDHYVFKQRPPEALTTKVSRWFTGGDRYTNSSDTKKEDYSQELNALPLLRDYEETLYEMGQAQQRKEANLHKRDVEVVMLAMKEFNKVRAILCLDGPVSTALVTKFLMARDFDVDDAIRLYKNYLGLRRTYYMVRLNPLNDPLNSELYSGKFTVLEARDQHGAAIAVFTARLHSPDTSHDIVIYNIYLQLDEAIKSQQTQENGIVLLYDFSNVTFKTCDVQLFSKILELFKTAYPVRLRKTLIVSPPFWFEPEMRLVSAVFRDTKLRRNIHIVTHSTLKEHLPMSSIPRGLGGECYANHLGLIELCISSHKERAGINDGRQRDGIHVCADDDDDNDIVGLVQCAALQRINHERLGKKKGDQDSSSSKP